MAKLHKLFTWCGESDAASHQRELKVLLSRLAVAFGDLSPQKSVEPNDVSRESVRSRFLLIQGGLSDEDDSDRS